MSGKRHTTNARRAHKLSALSYRMSPLPRRCQAAHGAFLLRASAYCPLYLPSKGSGRVTRQPRCEQSLLALHSARTGCATSAPPVARVIYTSLEVTQREWHNLLYSSCTAQSSKLRLKLICMEMRLTWPKDPDVYSLLVCDPFQHGPTWQK